MRGARHRLRICPLAGPWRENASSCSVLLRTQLVRSWRELHDPDVVAERIPDSEVGAVVALGDVVRDVHSLRFERLVGLLGVAGCEAGRKTACALADQLTDLGGGLLLHS